LKDRILVDTSVWIDFFRPRSETGDLLEKLLKGDAVWTCGVVLFEVLQGIKSENEKTQLLSILTSLPYIEMAGPLWQKAAEIATLARKNGITLPLSDMLIAAIAIENDLSVYTFDKHFEQIPDLKLYRK
jgi:tRNA(fMet)-specific endonuclease VapC